MSPGGSALKVPILYFHHVVDGFDHYTNCPPAAFRRFMEAASERFRTVTAADVLRAMETGASLPDNALMITFDDAYRDNLDHAVPILQSLKMCATFFAISDHLGRANTWNGKVGRQAEHMTASELTDLCAAGFEVGSHTRTHRPLTELSPEELEEELAGSRAALEDALCRSIRAVAYPYGLFDAAVESAATRHYAVGFSTGKSRDTDWRRAPLRLRRAFVRSEAPPHEVLGAVAEYLSH